jgi:alpha-glucosidase
VNSWTLLDSHDTPRFRTVAGDRDLLHVGIGLQMTTPGVPVIYAGDELGLEGRWGEGGRRPMPWSQPETWDTTTLERYRALARLRRSTAALARGGIRYVHVSEDTVAYLRETREERILCCASRTAEQIPFSFTQLEPLYESAHFNVWRIA